jgi:hypothetical protein
MMDTIALVDVPQAEERIVSLLRNQPALGEELAGAQKEDPVWERLLKILAEPLGDLMTEEVTDHLGEADGVFPA